MAKMTAKTFVEKAIDIAKNYKTLYVMGCFGAPMTAANKKRYIAHHSYNADATRTAMINAATADTFGFDCVCLIKGILWGWSGDKSKTYGGANYATNGVPDIGADTMLTKCSGVTTDFSHITVGEAVWCSGHIGIYIGDGLAVECTPRWKNNVQITAVANIGKKAGYNARTWTKHGKLPYVDYTGVVENESTTAGNNTSHATNAALEYAVGDVVTFKGTKHYASSNGTNGKTCKPGEARVTSVAKNGKHQYHLIKTTGSTSTVYGWVDAADISAAGGAIVKGSKVKVNKGAKTYTGGSLASFVYSGTYEVLEVSGDRVVIGKNGVVTAAVNIKNLTLVG